MKRHYKAALSFMQDKNICVLLENGQEDVSKCITPEVFKLIPYRST